MTAEAVIVDQSWQLASNARPPDTESTAALAASEVTMMNGAEAMTEGNVVPIRPANVTTQAPATTRESEKKWGKKVISLGFCVVPSLLLRAQQRLGLNPTQLAVLMQLCDFWWESDRKPYPGKRALGERLSLSPRQVQRYIAELEKAGLVKRIERRAGHGGKLTNSYDLSGLVERLRKLEPEFRAVEERAKASRAAVAKRGFSRPARRVQAESTLHSPARQSKTPGAYPKAEAGPGRTG